MMTQDHLAAADALLQAARSGQPIPPLREIYPHFNGEDAYVVQEINTRRQLESGARLVGRKVGLTARSVQQQLGVDQPDFGLLFAHMAFDEGQPIDWSSLMQPKVEAEVALVLERDLPEPGVTVAEMLRATAVCTAGH